MPTEAACRRGDCAALEAVHFRDVVEPHTVGVSVDEKEWSFGRLEFVSTKVVRSHGRDFDVVKEIREAARHGIKFHPVRFRQA
jgi:hypothetical protein